MKKYENDMRLSDGFNVAIVRQFKKSSPYVNMAQAQVNVVLCDGFNHCAFLTTEHVPLRVFKTLEGKTLKSSYQLQSQMEGWSKDGDLKFCKMGNKHFVALQQFGKFPRYDYYCKFIKGLYISILEARVSISIVSLMEEIQKSVVACFLKILSEYFNGAHFFDMSFPRTLSSKNRQRICGSGSINKFDQLHWELSKILVGRGCDKNLIYLGLEVKFTGIGDVGHFIYKIEVPLNQTMPIIYERELILKCSNPKKTLKATILQLNEETPIAPFSFSGDRVKLSVKGSKGSIGSIEGIFEVVNSISMVVQIGWSLSCPWNCNIWGETLVF